MEKETIKRIIFEYLYQARESPVQFFNGSWIPQQVVDFAGQKGVEVHPEHDARAFRDAFWELVSKNLVAPGTHVKSGRETFPFFSITEYGVECFEAGKILPVDPNGFLKSLYADVPDIDPVTKMYIEEAVTCFSNANYLSSAVMIGCALEKDIITTTEKFYRNLRRNKKTFKSNVLDKDKIKTKFDNFLKFLKENGYESKLDRTNKEKLGSQYPAIANLIRITRNEAGHPTGREVSRDEADANILLAKEAIKFSRNLLNPL